MNETDSMRPENVKKRRTDRQVDANHPRYEVLLKMFGPNPDALPEKPDTPLSLKVIL